MRYDRTEAMPKPVKRVSGDDRPVRIERGPKGVRFFSNFSGRELTKPEAVDAMRAYKRGQAVSEPKQPRRAVSPRQTRQPRTTFHAALYRTPFGEPSKSKLVAECHGETFAAMALKLASLCMQHTSDNRSAVEVVIEGSR